MTIDYYYYFYTRLYYISVLFNQPIFHNLGSIMSTHSSMSYQNEVCIKVEHSQSLIQAQNLVIQLPFKIGWKV